MGNFIAKIKNYIITMKLKQRLIIFIVIAILIPVLITTYTALTSSKSIIEDEAMILVKNTVEQVSRNIDELLKGQVYNVSSMINYDERVYEILTKEYDSNNKGHQKTVDEILLNEKIVTQYTNPYNYVKIAALYRKKGELLNTSLPAEQDNVVLSKLEEMGAISKKHNLLVQWYPLQKNFFTVSQEKDIRQQHVIIASRGIFHPETGEYVGNQLYTVPERSIYEMYQDVQLGKTGEIFVVDQKGRLISHSNEQMIIDMNLDPELVATVLGKENIVFHIKNKRQDLLVIAKTSPITQWITVGIVPLDEITSKINKIYSLVLIIMLISIIISIVFVVFMADSIVKPIKKIVKAMETVEGGNLNVHVNIKGQYEISTLGRYFNSMITRVRHLIQEEYELERKKKQAELNVLMAQINPHFLYNTLESIVWKAMSAGVPEISKMASSLGKFFRLSVNKGNIIVTVSEELEHVQSYVNIQKIRYGDKFDFEMKVENERIKHYKTLKIILQPIVENAIAYGIEHSERQGLIVLKVEQQADKLIFRVQDNGIGMSDEQLRKIKQKIYSDENNSQAISEYNMRQKRTGIGLTNVHERIKMYFGEQYGIEINSKEQKGTEIVIVVPVIDE